MKAIIFDMDGLLVDSEPVNFAVNKEMFRRYGAHLSKEEFVREWILKGTTSKEALKRHHLPISFPKFYKEKRKLHIATIRKLLKLKPGARQILRRFSQRYPLALATSGYRHNALETLKKFRIRQYFRVIVSREDVRRHKPHPDVFLEAARKLKVLPRQCVVIEDSDRGSLAAVRAGMKCIIVPCKFHKRFNHFSYADVVVKSLAKITPRTLEKLFVSGSSGQGTLSVLKPEDEISYV